jgi:hypothetical protein
MAKHKVSEVARGNEVLTYMVVKDILFRIGYVRWYGSGTGFESSRSRLGYYFILWVIRAAAGLESNLRHQSNTRKYISMSDIVARYVVLSG